MEPPAARSPRESPAAAPENPATAKDYSRCFGCGQHNPIGLKLRFRWEDGRALAEFTPGELHQGWPGIMHGGLVNALLDEAMGYVTYFQGLNTVTARMTVRFRRTARLGQRLLLVAETLKRAKRLVEVKGVARLDDGTVVAESTATMFVLGDAELPDYGIV